MGKIRLFLALLSVVLLTACSTTNTLQGSLPGAGELYAKGVSAYNKRLYTEGEEYLRKVLENYPLSPYAIEAQLKLADLYFIQERYEEAQSYYTTFYTFHPSHPSAPYALFQKGMCHLREVETIDRDQTPTRKALFAFQDLITYYPDSIYAEKSRTLISFLKERLAENEFYVGMFYYRKGDYKGALMRFKKILEDYPDTHVVEKTLYYVGEVYTHLEEEELARETFRTLIDRFPESPYVSVAKNRLQSP
ncbi:MAG TPA: outer membrane protein assembly factor BamD [Deltaproteobacteria bacterium]|nr:outer membrane protein assembly factor BamD [Deltaproteobacteria bacterium]